MDEGLAPAPHRRDRGLTPLFCRLPLKGGVMDPASPSVPLCLCAFLPPNS